MPRLTAEEFMPRAARNPCLEFALARQATGLTNAQAAQILGVPVGTVYCWNAGHRTPPAAAIACLQKHLKVSPGDTTATAQLTAPATCDEPGSE